MKYSHVFRWSTNAILKCLAAGAGCCSINLLEMISKSITISMVIWSIYIGVFGNILDS